MIKLHPLMFENRYGPPINITKVEAKYGAAYVGDFPARLKNGGWSADNAVSVFYRSIPTPPYTNRYFGLFRNVEYVDAEHVVFSPLMICDADYIEGHVFTALQYRDGIVYSTCTHDDRQGPDGSTIDGGWDYTRTAGGPLREIVVHDGAFNIAT